MSAAIAQEIAASGGWIPFARFMELALYAPGLGYYSAGLDKFGAGGDFVTAPEISALFGQAWRSQAAQVLRVTRRQHARNRRRLRQTGARPAAGTGTPERLAAALPHPRTVRRPAPAPAAAHRTRAPHLLPRFAWLDTLPRRFSGLVLGNEVLDAMPVHLVAWRAGQLFERGVTIQDGRFAWSERTLTEGELLRQALALPPAGFVSGDAAYTSEINLAAQGFVAASGRCWSRGWF